MKCEDVQLQLSDYVDETLPPAEMERVRAHLASCPACAREAEAQRRISEAFRTIPAPRSTLRLPTMFHTWLEAEREAASFRARELTQPQRSWLHHLMGPGVSALAACVLFAAGMVIGTRVLNQQQPDGRQTEHAVAQAEEIRKLQEEVAIMNKTVAWSLLQQQPTSERLHNVRAMETSPTRANPVNELLTVLAYDPSPTVRRGAVDALQRYVNEPVVPRALATALSREDTPWVQVAMIDLLATSRDPAAVSALTTFAQSETSNDTVREAASRALLRM